MFRRPTGRSAVKMKQFLPETESKHTVYSVAQKESHQVFVLTLSDIFKVSKFTYWLTHSAASHHTVWVLALGIYYIQLHRISKQL